MFQQDRNRTKIWDGMSCVNVSNEPSFLYILYRILFNAQSRCNHIYFVYPLGIRTYCVCISLENLFFFPHFIYVDFYAINFKSSNVKCLHLLLCCISNLCFKCDEQRNIKQAKEKKTIYLLTIIHQSNKRSSIENYLSICAGKK